MDLINVKFDLIIHGERDDDSLSRCVDDLLAICTHLKVEVDYETLGERLRLSASAADVSVTPKEVEELRTAIQRFNTSVTQGCLVVLGSRTINGETFWMGSKTQIKIAQLKQREAQLLKGSRA